MDGSKTFDLKSVSWQWERPHEWNDGGNQRPRKSSVSRQWERLHELNDGVSYDTALWKYGEWAPGVMEYVRCVSYRPVLGDANWTLVDEGCHRWRWPGRAAVSWRKCYEVSGKALGYEITNDADLWRPRLENVMRTVGKTTCALWCMPHDLGLELELVLVCEYSSLLRVGCVLAMCSPTTALD